MLPEKQFCPSVSVVVNTNGRAAALRNLLSGLRYLDYPNFEVCIIVGPTPDGTKELVAGYDNALKSADCPELNLSKSRNMGIACAAGDIVAFIDDDAIPEPEWLTQLVAAFLDVDVAAAGGFVYNHTGYDFQCKYVACDRLGNPRFDLDGPAPQYNFPLSNWYPHVLGTNAGFRRRDLVAIGGFDEEYEYYLDETDVCCRLNDSGMKIIQLDNAFVHHKFLPSHIRTPQKVITAYYPILKNKIYFSLINNFGHFSFQEVFDHLVKYVEMHRTAIQGAIDSGDLSDWSLEWFDTEAQRAWETGIRRGLSGERRTQPSTFFESPPPFRPFRTLHTENERKTFVFLSETFPPAKMAGVARYTFDISQAISALGHTVHVLTTGTDFNRVDFENGVWVHRIVPRSQPPRLLDDGTPIPQHILDYTFTQLDEIERIASHREITVIEGSGWNCECLAAAIDGRFPCVVNLVTPFLSWLDTHPEYREDTRWMRQFGDAILAAERQLYNSSSGIIAASSAIVNLIQERYHVDLADDRICFMPHGMADMVRLPRSRPAPITPDPTNERIAVLFVGRLELRKGIDVMLDTAVDLLAMRKDVECWIAGDDSLVLDGGMTAKDRFLAANSRPEIRDRVFFLGQVSEEELHWLYAECTLVVMPSRFESFGLTIVEAMMFAKPSIGCRLSGSEDVITDGENGILIDAADAGALTAAILRLIVDRDLRRNMGQLARARYEKTYAIPVIAAKRLAFLSQFSRDRIDLSDAIVHGSAKSVSLPHEQMGVSLSPGTQFTLDVHYAKLYVTFFQHRWSGVAEILIDGSSPQRLDLFTEQPGYRTIELDTSKAAYVAIRRPHRPSNAAQDTEVIIATIRATPYRH